MIPESPDAGSGGFLLPFLEEVVEYRGLLVSRYTAMAFEEELGSSEPTIIAAMSVPTADLSDGRRGMVLPHHVARAMFRARDLQATQYELDWPLTAISSREAPG